MKTDTQDAATRTAHTPGPWNHDKGFPCCIWASGVWVASTNVESVKDFSERESNARLIAAAPDMLAALKNSLDVMNGWLKFPPPGAEPSMLLKKTIAEVEAAIAKAGGQ